MPTNSKEYMAKKALLEQKQDKLTAGTGIYIDENTNTISATGGGGDVTDVKVNGASVVDLQGVAQVNLSGYATTSAMNSALAQKQDTLVAGTNISIDPTTNVISASTGASALDDLTNVDITTPADGDVLTYDAANQEWVNTQGGGGGGTTVIPNPQEPATDTLNTIRIGETVYDIAGSGGGSEGTYSTTLLWNYIDDNSGVIDYGTFNYTLNDNINNYDSLIIENVSYSGDISGVDWNATNMFSIDVNALNNSLNSNYINYTSFGDRSSRYYIKDTTFQKTINNQGNTNGLVNVYGIKYGGNASNKGELLYAANTASGAPVGTSINYLTNRPFKDYDLITVILSDPGDTGGNGVLLSPVSFTPNSLVNLSETGDYYLCMTGYSQRATTVQFNTHSFTVTNAVAPGEDSSRAQSIYKMYGFKFTGNNGGGTDVEANPQDSPTDTLETIRIGDVVYDIAGSGGGGLGGECKIDTLYQAASSSGASLNTPITYNNGKHLSDYDLCYVYLTVTASGDATLFESHSFCPKNQPRPVFRVTGYGNRFTNVEMTDTDFTVTAETGEASEYTYKVYTILGIKFGGLYTEDLAKGDWTQLISVTGGAWSSSSALPSGTTHVAIALDYQGVSWIPTILKLSDLDKLADEMGNSHLEYGFQWRVGSNYDNVAWDYDSTNKTFAVYAGYSGITAKVFAIKTAKPRITLPNFQTIGLGDGTTSRTFTLSETPNKVSLQGYTSGDGGWYESGWFIWGESFMTLYGAQRTMATGGYVGQVAITYGQDGKSFTITAANAFGAFNRSDNFNGSLLAE